jgi:hypothetical protein
MADLFILGNPWFTRRRNGVIVKTTLKSKIFLTMHSSSVLVVRGRYVCRNSDMSRPGNLQSLGDILTHTSGAGILNGGDVVL